MLTVAPETATGELPDVREEPGTGRRRWLDRFAPVVYLLGGIYLVGRLWLDPNQRLQHPLLKLPQLLQLQRIRHRQPLQSQPLPLLSKHRQPKRLRLPLRQPIQLPLNLLKYPLPPPIQPKSKRSPAAILNHIAGPRPQPLTLHRTPHSSSSSSS